MRAFLRAAAWAAALAATVVLSISIALGPVEWTILTAGPALAAAVWWESRR